jgi:cobalt-zinc-cadmium efflux system membrane fusion protein
MKNKRRIMIIAAVVLVVGATAMWRAGLFSAPIPVAKDEHRDEQHGEEKGHKNEERVVKLHEDDIKEFGIEIGSAGPGKIAMLLELPAEIKPNADRFARVVPRSPGIARVILKSLGDSVRAGETLAVIDSRELSDLKAAYLAASKRAGVAQANLRREEILYKKKISAELDYLEAKKVHDEVMIDLKSAEQKLHALGFSDDYLSKLPSQSDMSFTQYELRAPFNGVVIEKNIVQGQVLKDDSVAFVVADLSSVWATISIFPKDMPSVKKGQRVAIGVNGSGKAVNGVISYVSPVSAEDTRTSMARVILPNRAGMLQPGLFATARITLGETDAAVLVPKTALVTDNERKQIFVETPEGFRPSDVTLGKADDDSVEITGGLVAGQRYVSRGAFALKAQLSKGAFGDGHGH